MGFGQAITSGFSNYVNFSDRAIRSEYWFWVLFSTLASIAAGIVHGVLGITLIYPLFAVATFLPGLAVSVRRLHDTDRRGWWVFLLLIPLIGTIILIVWFCTRGTEGSNRFGPDRLAQAGPMSARAAS